MSDLISKQEVIKSIDRFIPTDPMMSDYTQGISVGLAIATRCIEGFSQENHDSSQGLVKDLISRKDAIEAVEDTDWYHQNKKGEMVHGANPSDRQAWYKAEDIYNVLESLPSAEPERHGRIFQEIVVEYPSISTYPEYEGKPYFSIKYTEDGQGIIGYGTYKPEVLSEYLKKYFMQSAQPEIIRCKDCKHWMPYDWMFSEVWQSKNMEDYPEDEIGCDCCDMNMGANDYCSRAERRGDSK